MIIFILLVPKNPIESPLQSKRSKVTPANISKKKKKIFCRAGILHIGPKWTLEKGSRGRCGWFLTGAIWRNFLCPKTLFLAVFWYLDWVYCSQLPQNASPITNKSYLHVLHKIFFLILVFLTQKIQKTANFSRFSVFLGTCKINMIRNVKIL